MTVGCISNAYFKNLAWYLSTRASAPRARMWCISAVISLHDTASGFVFAQTVKSGLLLAFVVTATVSNKVLPGRRGDVPKVPGVLGLRLTVHSTLRVNCESITHHIKAYL